MEPTPLIELKWLHDCILHGISYDTSAETEKVIELNLSCPTDLGYAPWDGKRLVLSAINVAASNHFLRATMGSDTIDAVRSGISNYFREQMMDARRMGIVWV